MNLNDADAAGGAGFAAPQDQKDQLDAKINALLEKAEAQADEEIKKLRQMQEELLDNALNDASSSGEGQENA
jgi:ElaB/YqjD/DUF883 family membrane-anchored ribosome-binding protein